MHPVNKPDENRQSTAGRHSNFYMFPYKGLYICLVTEEMTQIKKALYSLITIKIHLQNILTIFIDHGASKRAIVTHDVLQKLGVERIHSLTELCRFFQKKLSKSQVSRRWKCKDFPYSDGFSFSTKSKPPQLCKI